MSVLRVTIVYRYFWPDRMLPNDIAQWMAAAGHDVEVITAQPSYNSEAATNRRPSREVWQGVKVRRVPLLLEKNRGLAKILNGGLFILFATFLVFFGKKRDVIWTTSIPPVLQPFFLFCASRIRGAKFVYFLQDIYPEVAIASDMLKEGSFSRLARLIDNMTLRGADSVVTLSSDMLNTIEERGVATKNVRIINNFAAVASRDEEHVRSGPARFVFAGNIGRFQNLERLVEIFEQVDPNIAILEFLGEGRAKADLMEMVLQKNIRTVKFHAALPLDEAFEFISNCDVGIVSLMPGLYKLAYPSKTFTYLAAGLPVLALIETESELARETEARRVGFARDWSDSDESILSAVRELALNAPTAKDVRQRSVDLFDRENARRKWLDLLRELEIGEH